MSINVKYSVLFSYGINSEILARCSNVKDLGVIFEVNLSFSEHVNITLKILALLSATQHQLIILVH